jgi:hypothetical protein
VVMLKISRTSAPVANTWIGFCMPTRIGPMASAPPSSLQQFVRGIGGARDQGRPAHWRFGPG